jgi:hypothetical protein
MEGELARVSPTGQTYEEYQGYGWQMQYTLTIQPTKNAQ